MGMFDMVEVIPAPKCKAGHTLKDLQTKSFSRDLGHVVINLDTMRIGFVDCTGRDGEFNYYGDCEECPPTAQPWVDQWYEWDAESKDGSIIAGPTMVSPPAD